MKRYFKQVCTYKMSFLHVICMRMYLLFILLYLALCLVQSTFVIEIDKSTETRAYDYNTLHYDDDCKRCIRCRDDEKV